MGKYDNIRDKIMKTPTAKDIGPRELQSFLDHYGFKLKRSKGSHFMYEYPSTSRNIMLNIPMHSPVKPAYIDKIRDILYEIEG
ncbi:MAG: type II toxin-antitoxin system HicA family toxin [Clostridia bacterium]|nr:type II toxin-antitoxin system HicA family toxin [Clostridia bacterium]